MNRVIRLLIIMSALALAGSGKAEATEVGSGRSFGLGIFLGDPTGLTGKYFLDPNSALDFGLSFWSYDRGFGRGDCWDGRRNVRCSNRGTRLGLHADYLWQDNLVRGTAKLDWHVGIGGRVWFWDDYYDEDFALAARVPIGLDLTFSRPPFLELYFEIAPAFYVIPGTFFDLEGGIGIRFYF